MRLAAMDRFVIVTDAPVGNDNKRMFSLGGEYNRSQFGKTRAFSALA
jgi:hypothetical protein